jgi:thiol-disulfide isomerase/thioredoxin
MVFEVCPMSAAARLALLTLLATPLLQAQNDSFDGLRLLQQMSQRYASATTWYIEAGEERTIEDESCILSNNSTLIAAESGNEYHYESRTRTGSALHISDGATSWDFHSGGQEYRKQAAPDGGYTPDQSTYMAELKISQAMRLRKDFADMAKLYSSATRMPDEVLHDTGFDIPCYVVRATNADRKGSKTSEESMTDTLWIDRQTMEVLRRVRHEDAFAVAGRVNTPITIDSITRYSTVQLTGPVPKALFDFHPPADAELVTKFSDRRFGPDLTGQSAPDVPLVAADGTSVSLLSYRGKPVLLDFWATWCQPCVVSLPKLAEIATEAAPKGLVLLGVDEDHEEKRATEFLAKRNYTWPNTHDDGSRQQAFNRLGIPLVVLIDENGKIVFWGSGEDEHDLRMAIAALGPQYASMAPAPKPQDACDIASKLPPID